MVVYRYIIMPLRGPTCKMVLARIQSRLNSKLDPSVAKSVVGPLVFIYRLYSHALFTLNAQVSKHIRKDNHMIEKKMRT